MNLRKFQVEEVKPLGDFWVALRFRDGTEKKEDLSRFLQGPVFEKIRKDPEVFKSMRIDGGTITWETGADIDPLVL